MTDPMHPPGSAEDTPSFAESILGNLEADPKEPLCYEIKRFRERFLALPPELQDLTLSFMETTEPLSITPNRTIPQEYWRQMLARGRLLPFLWELDAVAIDEIIAKKNNNNNNSTLPLDWERLVRALSQPVVRHGDELQRGLSTESPTHCYDRLDISDGLRNRRRIWQLVEEMRVGDVLPGAWTHRDERPLHMPALPRYWDEEGAPVQPPLRFPRRRDGAT